VRDASAALVRLSQQVAAVDAVLTAAGGGRDAGIGSNAWAVAGSRTASGRPLLANDPHLAPAMPSVWYQVGLHCTHRSARCPYDVAGFSFSGLPGVIIGHNDRIGWGFTNLGPDVADLYLEKVAGDTVEYDGRRVPLTTRTERIDVAGGESVTMTVRSTRHGPLVSGVDPTFRSVGRRAPAPPGSPPRGRGYAVALSWTALTPGHTADAIFAMDAARSWPQFRRAARLFEVPAQNLVYADRDGHIGYQAPGTIPIRRTGTGDLPAPGWDPRYDWAGTIPYDALPSVLDPPEGYVVTANQAVTPPSYRYHLTSDWDYGYRSQRIVDLLDGTRRPLGAADMARIQADTRNPIAPVLVPALLAPGVTVDAATARARDLLRGWDFTQPEDSAAAAYLNAVWRALLADTFHDQLPRSTWPDGASRWYAVVEELLARPDSPWWDDTRTPAREHRDDILARALRDARVALAERLGADPAGWQWGQLHQLDLVNASLGTSGVAPVEALFNRGPVPVAGGAGAVDATSWDPSAGFAVTAVPSMRMIVDMADLDASRWVNLTGASGHAYSDHYGDQIPRWRTRTTTRWPFTPGAVERAAVDRLVLRPQ
jgi:penicillin amidase